MSMTGFYPCSRVPMEMRPAPSRSGPTAVGRLPCPAHRPSNRGSPAPSDPPRLPLLGKWTRPVSAPPENRDTTQSAPPGAAIAPASVARRVAHPSPGQAFAHPAAARELTRLAPTEFAASSRITEQMTKEKLTAICRMPGLATELLPTFQDHSFSGTSRESSSIEDSTSY